jgi:hypothetical protein
MHTIERKIPYEITPKGATTDRGAVTIKVAVTPLVLDSPRPRIVIDSPNFLVAGRTLKTASIELEGSQIPPSPDGSFARKIRIEKMGVTEVKLRATAKDMAPRTVAFEIKRVSDLAAEAKEFAAQAPSDAASLLADPKALTGKPIVLAGDVIEARAQGYQTIVLLDVQEGCKKAPCLVRVVRAGNDPMAKGDKIRVFGHVTGLYEAKGTSPVPEVDMDFLVPNRR